MKNRQLINLLESVLGTAKNSGNESTFNCPYCNHHKKKLVITKQKRFFLCSQNEILRLLPLGENSTKIVEAVLCLFLGIKKSMSWDPYEVMKNVFLALENFKIPRTSQMRDQNMSHICLQN